jgi:hypothetical protein
MTFSKAVDEFGAELTLPVTGSVLDNTIANPSLITVPGRYIVPTSVTTGVFVGQEGKLADFNGETFEFSSPPNPYNAVITTGVNYGKTVQWDGTQWETTSPTLITTTSLVPSTYDGTNFIPAIADSPDTTAHLVKLSDGSYLNTGKVQWVGHGLTVGRWYYLSQTAAGEYVTPAPDSGISQKLFFVEDEDTLHINNFGAASAIGDFTTTSMVPMVYDGSAYVDAQASAPEPTADLIRLSDDTQIHSGKVTWTGHGLTVGSWYYLSQTEAGEYVTPAPTIGWSQQLFFVEDADTIHVDIEPAELVGSDNVEDNAPLITYQINSNTFPANPTRADTMYVTTDGTRTGRVTEEWVYDGVGWTLVDGTVMVSGAVIDNTIANSANVTVVGRYIVPATGTAGAFVGQENQYADWAGALDETDPANPIPINFTFSAPTDGDKVSINSGSNAGTIWSYDGTLWTKEAGTVSVPAAGQLLTITNGATITSPGNPDSAWSNVAGGSFTIAGAGRWDVEYCLSFTSTGSVNQARIVNTGGVEVAGSRSAQTTAQTGAVHSMNTGFQLETTGAGVYQLQARTFNNGTITVRNPMVTTGFPALYGQSVIKWTKALDFPVTAVAPNIIVEQNYVSAINSGGDQTLLTTGTDLRFSSQGSVAGAMVYNPSTGVFSGLVSGKTYDLSAFVNFYKFTSTEGYVKVSWVNATTNAEISGLVAAVVSSVTRTTGNESSQPFAGGRFTAPSNMSVKLRVITAAGNSDMRGSSLSSASIQEVTGVAVDPALVIPQTLSRMVVSYSAPSTAFPSPGVAPIGVNATPQITGSRFAMEGNTVVVAAGGRVRLTGPTSGNFSSAGMASFHWVLEGQTTKYQPPNSVNATGLVISANAVTPAPEAQAILEFTPTTNVRLQLYVTSSSGSFFMSNAYSVITVEELPTMTVTGTVDTALTPVNDQSNNNYYDVGNVRHQWGRDTSGNASTRTVTLPAPFANTGYSIAYGCEWNADNLVRSGNTVAKTLTSFTARVQHNEGGSATNFDWIAIGRKP